MSKEKQNKKNDDFTPRKARIGKQSPIGILKRRPELLEQHLLGENRKKMRVSVTKDGLQQELVGIEELSTQETLEVNANVLNNQLAIIMEDENELQYDITDEQLNEWRQQFAFLEDSVVLDKLDIKDLEILDNLYGNLNEDDLPPYSFKTRRQKKRFFKKLTEDFYKMNQPQKVNNRKSIKINETKNTTFEFHKQKRISTDFKRLKK